MININFLWHQELKVEILGQEHKEIYKIIIKIKIIWRIHLFIKQYQRINNIRIETIKIVNKIINQMVIFQ